MSNQKGNKNQVKLEVALEDYLKKKAELSAVEAEVAEAQKVLKSALGDTRSAIVGPFKVIYDFNKTIDQERLQSEQPGVYQACLGDAPFEVTKFRVNFPDLVSDYEIESKVRPLKVIPA